MCTPTERPIKNAIKTNHLFACASPNSFSHLRIDQKTTAVNKEDIAYTSPSTAENQNESEKVYAKAPIRPPNNMENFENKDMFLSFFSCCNIFLLSRVIIQNKNAIVNALHNADMKFIIHATLAVLPNVKFEKKFAKIVSKLN